MEEQHWNQTSHSTAQETCRKKRERQTDRRKGAGSSRRGETSASLHQAVGGTLLTHDSEVHAREGERGRKTGLGKNVELLGNSPEIPW